MKKPRPPLLLALSLALVLSISACDELTTSPAVGASTTGAALPTTTAAVAGAEGTTTGPVSGAAAASPLTAPGVWTELHPTGELPSARGHFAMVFELFTGGAFLFGGSSANAYVDDTWFYDPIANAWTELDLAGTGPPARGHFAMVYDSQRGKVLLCGGQAETIYFNDIWVYDRKSDTWTNLNPSGSLPPPRTECCMAYDFTRGRAILFGGVSSGPVFLNDTWAYDPDANTWTNLNPSGSPTARICCSMVYDSRRDEVILFGGSEDGTSKLNDTWAYDPDANTWTNLNPADSPTARMRFSMAYVPDRGQVVLFGGLDADNNIVDDTWAYDLAANNWRNLNPPGPLPETRIGASLVYDSLRGELILFGGWSGTTNLNDTWVYRLQ